MARTHLRVAARPDVWSELVAYVITAETATTRRTVLSRRWSVSDAWTARAANGHPGHYWPETSERRQHPCTPAHPRSGDPRPETWAT